MSPQLFFRCLFFAAALFATFMALDPHPPALPIDQAGDKVEHMLAFATLAVLATLAFREVPWMRIGERLSFFGALIEVFQSIPALHRDCDPLDWMADTAAIAVALGLCYLVSRRTIGAAWLARWAEA